MDFVRLSAEIEERYRRYLRTTFHFKDPRLRESFRSALEQGRLSKGPFLEATPAFRRGLSPRKLFPSITSHRLDEAFLEALEGDRRLYVHQEETLRRIASGRNVVVATGTGSGKTECFLYPILLELYRAFEDGALSRQPGVRALILYPMNALAYDQRERLGRLHQRLEQTGARFRFTFGQYIGATPENANDAYRHASDVLAHRMPGELVLREEMREAPPHILLTNFSMLEYQLLRPQDSPLFDGPFGQTWSFLVLDEVHQYRGTRGTEMGLLLRRLKRRIRESGDQGPFRCVATSATLGDGDKDRGAVARFAESLFDEPFDSEDVILPQTEELGAEGTEMLPAEAYDAVLRAIRENDAAPAERFLSDLPGADSGDVPESIAARVGEHLHRDRRVRMVRQHTVGGPRHVSELAETLFPDAEAERRVEALTCFTELLNRAEQPHFGGPFLSVRYHFFLRALEGAFLRLLPEPTIMLAPQGRSEGEALVFEIALCRECGQHYLVGRRLHGRFQEAVRDPSRDDFGVSFFRPIEPRERNGEDPPLGKAFNLCVQCGAFSEPCRPAPCDHNATMEVQEQDPTDERADEIARCSACGYSGRDPVREVIHGGDGPHAMIATTLFERLPGDPKKILAFADSRQEAAYFAWYLDDTYRSILRRTLLLRAITTLSEKEGEPLSLADVADGYRRQCLEAKVIGEAASRREQWHQAWSDVYRELLTPETRLSLAGVGLVRWSIQWPGALEPLDVLAHPPWSLDDEDARALTFLLLDSFRRDRAVELDTRGDVDLDWISLGLLGSQRFARLGPPRRQRDVVSWNGRQGWRMRFLAKILTRRGLGREEALDVADRTLRALWEHLATFADRQPTEERLLTRVRDGRRLNPVWWRVMPVVEDTPIYRCEACGRIETVQIAETCPRHGCEGRLARTDLRIVSDNHYRILYQSGLRETLAVEEHTAQLTTERGREVQREFQDGRIHVLSCSTTFELGVDLGDLNTVFLRNVPPESFNYVQRVGRAGRRAGFPGFAVTYCRRGPHDLYHFAEPTRLLSGRTRPPVISLDNARVAERHLTAAGLASFFRAHSERFNQVRKLLRDWVTPDLVAAVRNHLLENRAWMEEVMRDIFPKRLATELGIDDGSWLDYIAGSESRLAIAELEAASDYRLVDELEERARMAHRYKEAEWAKRRKQTIAEEDVLSFLSRKAVIPKYGFPVDVVELDTHRIRTRQAPNVSLDRDLSIAIGEFAPTATLVAGKREWQSYGLKKVPEKEWERKNYKVCHRHNALITWNDGEPVPELPCGDSAPERTYVIPIFGFVTSKKPPGIPTGRPARLFTTRPYFLELAARNVERIAIQGGHGPLVTISKAAPGRMAVLCEGRRGKPFYICNTCGAGFIGFPRAGGHKTAWNSDCGGTLSPRSLGHEFVTDVVQVQFHATPERADIPADPTWLGYGIATALLEGMAAVIDVPATDLNVTVGRSAEAALPLVVLYDAVPGGAGLVARIEDPPLFEACLKAAYDRVSGGCGCGEDTSCYGCLRSYRNQFAHTHLKRGPVMRYLGSVLDRWPERP